MVLASVSLFSIRTRTKYPASEVQHGYGTVQVSLESVCDLGVGERNLAMSFYKLKESVTTEAELNYAFESLCILFTLCYTCA